MQNVSVEEWLHRASIESYNSFKCLTTTLSLFYNCFLMINNVLNFRAQNVSVEEWLHVQGCNHF